MMKLLITPAEVAASTTISLNAEPHKLAIAIPLAQGRHLRPVLGVALFEELLSFADSAPDLPATSAAAAGPAYLEAVAAWRDSVAGEPLLLLFDEVKAMLCAWALIEAWPSLLGHITPAGIVTKVGKGEGTSTADELLVRQMFAGLQSVAVFHTEELASWLQTKGEEFSQFKAAHPVPSGRIECGGIAFA